MTSARRPFRAWRLGGSRAGSALRTLAIALAFGLSTADAHAEIVIGIAAPLSGRLGAIGEAMAKAAGAAVAKAEAQGSGPVEPLRIEIADDGCSAASAEGVAKRLAEAGARIVIGHWCGSAAAAAAPLYAAAGIVLLTTTRHPAVTQKRAGSGIFRLAGRDDMQGQEAGRYVANAYKRARIAIVHDRTAYARALAAGFQSVLTDQELTPVLSEGIVASEKDYSALARRVVDSNAGLVYYAGFPTEAAIILREMRLIGSRATVMGGDALATAEFAERAGREGDGTLLTISSAADPVRAAARLALAATEIAIETVRSQSGSGAIARHIATTTFGTSEGPIAFDAQGDASIASFAVNRWQDGKLLPVD